MEEIIRILHKQTKVLLDNIEATLNYCDDSMIQESSSNWPIWKQFYHMLHSLDEWFINPIEFKEPDIHQPHFRTSEHGPGMLAKNQLYDYFISIRARINNYIDSLQLSDLEKYIEKGNST